MNRQELLKKFTVADERIIFARFLDIVENCLKYHEQGFTDFLDPYKVEKFISAIMKTENSTEISLTTFGGAEDSERKIIGVSPEYLELKTEDFPITAVKIASSGKFGNNLTHRDFLGSVLGLGIEREKVGDVLLTGSGAFVLLNKGISDYVCVNLSRVANAGVEVYPVPTEELYGLDDSSAAKRITVQSLRLDAVLSAAYNISRSKSSGFISSGKVFINWISEENAAKQVNKGDTITLRGTGRIKIMDILGNTKKGRIVLEIR